MPVFARVAAADPVQETAVITTALTGPIDLSVEAVCTCPVSDDALMQAVILGHNDTFNNFDGNNNNNNNNNSSSNRNDQRNSYAHQHISPVHFQGHLSTCPLQISSSSHALAQLKQQALLKKQQLLKAQQEQRKRDPFESIRQMPTRTCHLYPGSKFQGMQKSGSHGYEVMVDIKDVNLNDSTLCGYLHIKGLTEEYPELTTFFDAEIVGMEYSFLTQKWDASEVTDEEHWKKFKPFENVNHLSGLEDAKCDFRKVDVVFMRWKEHFLVPDHHVEGITGASFAGFYYICYHKQTGRINGYYYHQSSEKFQELSLDHVAERSSFGSYEFR